ncbi:RING finger protein ETP1-like protein [Smittium culicis]|uniref:RING finger protein ETP1-like protein n=1 Tax=Smittium culicis TaxID=133412 RepID=A0A1R1Y2R6_9FUNG|nr:RING finger protein ETP1-like protein [Smittium culicis]
MYNYSIFIETFRLNSASIPENDSKKNLLYYKSLYENHWVAYNNSAGKSNIPAKSKKNSKSKYNSNQKPVSDFIFDSKIKKNLSLTDSNYLSVYNEILDYLSTFFDYRAGKLSIETYSSQDLETIPEIEELETKFFKIQMDINKSPKHSSIYNQQDIVIGWDKKDTIQDASNDVFLEVSENSQDFESNRYDAPSRISSNLINETTDIENDYNQYTSPNSRKATTVVPMGIFEIIPSDISEYELGVLHLYRSNISSQSSKIEIDKNSLKNYHEPEAKEYLLQPGVSINDPSQNGKVISVLAVPAYMTPSDFVSYAGIFRKKISQFRVIRNSSINNYMVIIKFKFSEDAKNFYNYFNGKSFSPLEPETCHVVYISSIIISNGALPLNDSPLFFDDPSIIPSCTNKSESVLDQNINDQSSSTNSSKKDNQASSLFINALKNNLNNRNTILSDQINSEDSESCTKSTCIELPTCPVCLERLDTEISGLLTILCQHTFHSSCLSKWSDNSCPVCRLAQSSTFVDNELFDESLSKIENSKISHLSDTPTLSQRPLGEQNLESNLLPNRGPDETEFDHSINFKSNDENSKLSKCSVCNSILQLWICLICGYVGCGRYKYGHAHAHYLETGHIYSMDLNSQRVWDYVGDGYVHRILLNRTDGKLVELSDPASSSLANENYLNNSVSEMRDGAAYENIYGNINNSANYSGHENGEIYHYGPSLEYGTEFSEGSSNLAGHSGKISNNSTANVRNIGIHGQRRYGSIPDSSFEVVREKLAAVAVEYEQTLKSQLLANSKIYEKKILSLENMCKDYLKKQINSSRAVNTLTKSLETEQKLSNSLLKKLESVQEENAGLKGKVEDLSEQVKDLYAHFETLSRVQQDKELGEMVQGGTIQIVQKPESSKTKKKKGKK